MKMSSRAKSSLIIAGTALISIGALIAVLNIDNNASAAEPASSASSSPSTSVVISVPPIQEQKFEVESGTSSAFVPSSGASQAAELTKIEKPVAAPPAPSVASGTNMTDKNKKPTYSSSSAPAKSSSKAPTKKSTHPGGNDPVFGNTQAPHGETTTVGNPGDKLSGDKVGTMD